MSLYLHSIAYLHGELLFSLSVCLSVQEGKDGSASASYYYITLRLPGRFLDTEKLIVCTVCKMCLV